MRYVKFHKDEFDGTPLVTVTLDAVDVEKIYTGISTLADDHTHNVQEAIESGHHKDNPDWWGMTAQAESQKNVGWWEMIHHLISKDFWEWAEEIEGDDNDGLVAEEDRG